MEKGWQPTSLFLPGKFHGQRSLVGYCSWGHNESHMTEGLTLSLSFNLWCLEYVMLCGKKNFADRIKFIKLKEITLSSPDGPNLFNWACDSKEISLQLGAERCSRKVGGREEIQIMREPTHHCWISKGLSTEEGEIPWRREWQSTLVFLPGESHGQRSLAGYSPWGGKL